MALTNAEKERLANSDIMVDLYHALAATHSAVFKRIQNEVDNPGFGSAELDAIVTRLTHDLNNQIPSLLDSGNCGPGYHWDPALGDCVPDRGKTSSKK